MEEHVPVVSTRGSRKHKRSEKVLLPRATDQELVLEQDDTGKEMGRTLQEIKHYHEIQKCEDTADEKEDQALNSGDKNILHTAAVYSQARVEKEKIDIGSTSVHNYSCDINTYSKSAETIGPQSDDNISVSSMVTNFSNNNDDAVNPSALEKEPTALSKNIDVSPDLPEIGASKDIDDKVCCVFCAKEVPVKNAGNLKKGQHLTRPGQSRHSFCILGLRIPLSFLCYRHHLFLKDIVFFPDQTAMLTFIHMTKCGRLIDIYETVESCNVPDENLNVVQYNNPKYPPEEIIDRAESSVNFLRKAKPDSYNLLFNNCESVIREFMVGSKISLQALFYFEIIANILMFLFCIASWFKPWYIRMFTFVAFCIYCILFGYLAMDLSTYYKKDKIICGFHLKSIRIKIFCRVTFWTLIIFFIFLKCSS